MVARILWCCSLTKHRAKAGSGEYPVGLWSHNLLTGCCRVQSKNLIFPSVPGWQGQRDLRNTLGHKQLKADTIPWVPRTIRIPLGSKWVKENWKHEGARRGQILSSGAVARSSETSEVSAGWEGKIFLVLFSLPQETKTEGGKKTQNKNSISWVIKRLSGKYSGMKMLVLKGVNKILGGQHIRGPR